MYLRSFFSIAIAAAFVLGITGIEAQQAFADVIDFETGFVELQPVGVVVTATNTVTFEVGPCLSDPVDPGFIAQAGVPSIAYNPDDQIPAGASGGEFFLTDEDNGFPFLESLGYCISFATPVDNLSLDLYDYREAGAVAGDIAKLSVFDAAGDKAGKSDKFIIPLVKPVDPNLATLSIQNPFSLISSAIVSFTGPDSGTGIDNITFDTNIVPGPGPGPGPGPTSNPGGGGAHEPPTIGMNYAGTNQMVINGMGIDGQFWTVTQFYHEEMKLIQMLTSPHTISNTIYCNEGVEECDYVGIAFTTKEFDFNDPVMKVEAQKTDGEWIISWYDPQDFIQDPDDAIPGEITFTAQESGEFLLTSFTINFKNKDTGELVIGVQVRDVELGVRTFWFNEGVEFIDSDAYPSIVTEFENTLEIDSLCLNEDPTYRYSCAFAKKVQLEIERAEILLT